MLRDMAKAYYQQDYNCAEAMLRAINEAWALRLSDESLRLAAGFGGGMGREDACGAMTGAVMGLSRLLVKDRAHATPDFGALCARWVDSFTRDLGSSLCADLKPLLKTEEAGCLETVLRAADSFETFMKENKVEV